MCLKRITGSSHPKTTTYLIPVKRIMPAQRKIIFVENSLPDGGSEGGESFAPSPSYCCELLIILEAALGDMLESLAA